MNNPYIIDNGSKYYYNHCLGISLWSCSNMNKQNVQRKTIFSLFSVLISFACFVFVIWQSIKCLSRFTQKPRGTSTTIENTANLPFPAITICGGSGTGYNLNELKKCSNKYVQYVSSLKFRHLIIYFIKVRSPSRHKQKFCN